MEFTEYSNQSEPQNEYCPQEPLRFAAKHVHSDSLYARRNSGKLVAVFTTGFSMFARFLKIWLIVSILGYGIALASEVHNEPVDNKVVQLSADHPQSDTVNDVTDDSDCNHCGHGTSHLLGLCFIDKVYVIHSDSILLGYHTVSRYSFSPPSLFRPPIVS